MFKPFKGMLFEWTENNIQLSNEGRLPPIDINLNSQQCDRFYSLNDKFHHKTKKRSAEKNFRDIRLCKDLMLNTSIAEQCNAQMGRDR